MKKLALALCLIPSLAWGQASVRQDGAVTRDNAVKWSNDHIVKDAGGVNGDNTGRGFNPFSVLDKLGLGFCSNSDVIANPFSQVCLGHDSSGNGIISLILGGGITTQPNLNIQAPYGINVQGGTTTTLSAGGNTGVTVTPSGTALAGTDTATVPPANDNSNKIATTSFVNQQIGASGTAPIPFVVSNAALAALPQATTSRVMRLGVLAQGDAPALVFNGQTGTCASNGLTNDGGSCVNASDGNSWRGALTSPIDASHFGLSAATKNFYNVTTTAGSGSVTLAGANVPASCAGSCYIVILGAGQNEQRYIGQITAGSGTSITVSPAPTLSMSAFSTIVYYGKDNSASLNAAFAAAVTLRMSSTVPAGIYLAASPIQCSMVNYNNNNLPPPICTGSVGGGATIMAVGNMSGSTPVAGTLLTLGGYANGSDFSQYIRNSMINGNGLTLDCDFICNYAFGIPFSQEMDVSGYQVKNSLLANMHIGAPGSPLPTAAMHLHNNSITRDIYYVPVTNITSANPPVVTTSIDHGVTTGRIVTVIGANNVPGSVTGSGPISFIATATDARHLQLHGVNGTGWAAFTGTANIALTYPTNSITHVVTGVTTANPTQISISPGNINISNGQTWCIYGVGGTSSPFVFQENAPDGCYTISNVSGSGGDGPFQFTVPVNTTGFTFTGGGIAYQQLALGDMGVYEDNVTDFDAFQNFIIGTRYGFYANPSTSGYDGKYTNNHFTNFAENGLTQAAHYLGGHNALIAEECDVPLIFCGQFVNAGNTASGVELQGSGFNWIQDAATWMWRLDTCSGCTTYAGVSDITVTGGALFGQSGSIRVSELSNHATAGNAAIFSAIPNYHRFGLNVGANVLYAQPDSDVGDVNFIGTPGNPAGTASTTLVAMGLGGTGCIFTPMYHTAVYVSISGTMGNTVAADGVFGAVYVGTGAAPTNGTTLGGGVVQIGAQAGNTTFPAGGAQVNFNWGGVIIGLTPGTTYWFDAVIRAVTGGTASIANLTCTAVGQ